MINENEENVVNSTENEASEPVAEASADITSNDTPAEAERENDNAVDYAEVLKSDMKELSEEFSDGDNIQITDLKNPMRYGALRDMELTPREAYLASGGKKEKIDNRAHLSSSVPRKLAASFSEIPKSELEAARELFEDMSDSEIRNLYKKVTQ